MVPLQYFPFSSSRFEMRLGVAPLAAGESILARDEETAAELQEKSRLLAELPEYYQQALPGSEPAQQEAAALLGFSDQTLAQVGAEVAEDLLILRSTGEQELIAGHLCFPNGWCLDEKMGRPLLDIHAPVPGYAEKLGSPTRNLLERLKPGRPVGRLNWGMKPTNRLDLSSRWNDWVRSVAGEVTPANAGDRCYLRVERQTLAMLPESGCVLFTIHTYQQAIGTLSGEQRDVLRGVLETIPAPMADYKGLTPVLEPALQWLRSHSR
jgi:dimethylamine monooxygenase subunit A